MDEKHCLRFAEAFQKKKKNLKEVSVKCLEIPVETNMPKDLVIKCHDDS